MRNISENLRQTINSIPRKPGIYKMYDKQGNLLYIGKSKSLNSRVRSYFYGEHKQSKINILVNNIYHIETIITDTHLEAQILECALIKKNKPVYNSQFKNHNKYAYLKIEMTNRYNNPLSLVFENLDEYTIGPFKNKRVIRNLITMFQNIYPIGKKDNNYYFDYNLIPKTLKEIEFQENKENILQILCEDKCSKDFIDECINKMNIASFNFDYNRAIIYRDIIKNLEYIYHVKNNHNSFNYPHLLVGERIDNGYKLFYISYNLIILKRKYNEINEGSIVDFIDYGNKLREINLKSNEKRNLDYKGIIYSELRDNEFKKISLINEEFSSNKFIKGLIDIRHKE